MTESSTDAGTIQVLVEQLEKQDLPQLLAMKERVDAGKVLEDFDIDFLEQVFREANTTKPLLDRHPEWQPLAAKVFALYKEITEKALENQNAAKKPS